MQQRPKTKTKKGVLFVVLIARFGLGDGSLGPSLHSGDLLSMYLGKHGIAPLSCLCHPVGWWLCVLVRPLPLLLLRGTELPKNAIEVGQGFFGKGGWFVRLQFPNAGPNNLRSRGY